MSPRLWQNFNWAKREGRGWGWRTGDQVCGVKVPLDQRTVGLKVPGRSTGMEVGRGRQETKAR